MLGRKRAPVSKLERSVSSLTTGALIDYLKRYVNSAGNSVRLFEDTGDPAALDALFENGDALQVLARELKTRVKDHPYSPAPNMHLQELVEKYQFKTGVSSMPPGMREQP